MLFSGSATPDFVCKLNRTLVLIFQKIVYNIILIML